jgi:uncharacterized metal-binding protein
MTASYPQCAVCPYEWAERYCRSGKGKAPKNCPTLKAKELAARSLAVLEAAPDLAEFVRQASVQEAMGYGDREQGYARTRPIKPRIEETAEFARRMGYRRLGLAFCGGLRREAEVVHRYFEDQGFEVVSVMCKAGGIPKSDVGVAREEQVDPFAGEETMCNPVLQAMAANAHGVELNVLLGLCVGHDSLFIKHAEAPVTVLAAKDRLLAHNPLAAVYQYEQYYRFLQAPKEE